MSLRLKNERKRVRWKSKNRAISETSTEDRERETKTRDHIAIWMETAAVGWRLAMRLAGAARFRRREGRATSDVSQANGFSGEHRNSSQVSLQ
jgi:hypothetical protein